MRWLLIVLLTTQVATCGQKGPLYLPADARLDALHAGALPAAMPVLHR